MRITLLLLFIAFLGCEKPVKKEPVIPSLNKEMANEKSFKSNDDFSNVEEAIVYLDSMLQAANVFERKLNNLVVSSPEGDVSQADEMLLDIVELLVSVRYQQETIKSLKQYYEDNGGNVSKGNMTNKLLFLDNGGWSIGNACDQGSLHITVDGDIELNGEKIELLNGWLTVNGRILNNGVEILEGDIQNHIIKRCENSKLIVVTNE